MKTFVKNGRTRLIDTRDKALVVRAEFAGWVEQADPAPAAKPAAPKPQGEPKP